MLAFALRGAGRGFFLPYHLRDMVNDRKEIFHLRCPFRQGNVGGHALGVDKEFDFSGTCQTCAERCQEHLRMLK